MSALAPRRALLAACLVSTAAFVSTAAPAQDRAAERSAMIETIKRHARAGSAEYQSAVLRRCGGCRATFSCPRTAGPAYEDRPLPIGHGQTISQPFIVALMTDLINARPDDTVLEIGTARLSGSRPVAARRQGLLDRDRPRTGQKSGGTTCGLSFGNVEVRWATATTAGLSMHLTTASS